MLISVSFHIQKLTKRMEFKLLPNHQLNCELSDPLFQNNIQYLLNLANRYYVTEPNLINSNNLSDVGDECWHIIISNDLINENDYFNIFTGTHSENFIQIMLLIQLIWQRKENLNTYSMSERTSYPGGVDPNDKDYLISYLKDLRNKLLIINHLIEKHEPQH